MCSDKLAASLGQGFLGTSGEGMSKFSSVSGNSTWVVGTGRHSNSA